MRTLLIAAVACGLSIGASSAFAGPATGAAVGAGTGAVVAGPPGAVVGGVAGAVLGKDKKKAAACRDEKGKFAKCTTVASTKPAKCRDAKGRFKKC